MQCILFVHLHATWKWNRRHSRLQHAFSIKLAPSPTPTPSSSCHRCHKMLAILFIVLQFFKQFHFQFGSQFSSHIFFFVVLSCSSVFLELHIYSGQEEAQAMLKSTSQSKQCERGLFGAAACGGREEEEEAQVLEELELELELIWMASPLAAAATGQSRCLPRHRRTQYNCTIFI